MAIHKCDLERRCGIVLLNIEHIPSRNDGHNSVEHHGKDSEDKHYSKLILKRYFLNGATNETSIASKSTTRPRIYNTVTRFTMTNITRDRQMS
eukprot:4181500-Alexandrium_andersonii.AAC.1